MRNIVDILSDKEIGIDCNEDESAVIKRYLRANVWEDTLVQRLTNVFPAEASEVNVGSDLGRGDPNE